MQHEFNRIVDERLVACWGQSAYPDQNVALLWRYVRDLSTGDFELALDELGMTVTRSPTIGQVRGACLPAIRRAAEAKRREMVARSEAGSTCRYCGGQGWVYALSYDNPLHEFAFLCSSCPAPGLLGFTASHGARPWAKDDEHGFFLRLFADKANLEHAHEMQRKKSQALVDALRAKAEAEAAKRAESSACLETITDLLEGLPF